MKQTYYFSHDRNARNDEKILALRMKTGMEGYGVYWAIIERLSESTNYMSVKDYNIIAFDLRVSADVIKSVINDFGLFDFSEDGKLFYSRSLNQRMIKLDNLQKQRSEAGKKSAEKREKNNDRSTTVQRPLQKNSTNKEKERKEKENKVKTIEDRKSQFKELLSPFLEKYGRIILNEFFSYWTEHGVNDKKMRFEKEKSFDVGRRLETWFNNQKKWEQNGQSKQQTNGNSGKKPYVFDLEEAVKTATGSIE